MEVNSNQPCHNCAHPISERATYCENCGQAKVESRLNIWKLFKDFISNIFNLDGRLFRSLRHMWRPAFLAQEYMHGRRKSYVNPIRFYLLMIVSLFFLLKSSMNDDMIEKSGIRAIAEVEQKKLAEIYDTAIYSIIHNIDTIQHRQLRDRIFTAANKEPTRIFTGGNFLGWDIKEYYVTRYDAYSMDIDSLFKKYNLTEWYDQLFIEQLIKVDKNRSGSASYFISKLMWGVILYTFLVALLMKLLYIRNNYYYVEHLILVILYVAKVMLVLNIVYLIPLLGLGNSFWNYFMVLIYGLVVLYFFITLKKFFQQGYLKTFIKSTIICFASFYLLVISISLVSIISLILL